jgi:flagellar basal-body rod protein FlgF
MENAALIGLSRQVALRRTLDVIANNVANINTNGFKADGSVFEEYVTHGARENRFIGADRRVSFVHDRATWTDMRAGGVQHTGNPLDLAIDGTAFFAVETPRGERYTRNGGFQINAAGELVTSEGYRVLGDAGPVVFQPQDRSITIGRDGSIAVGNDGRGQIRLVEFAQPGRLRKDGTGTFAAPADLPPVATTESRVVQGAVEKSNVQGVIEMSRLIEVTRTYAQIAQMTEQHGTLRKTAIERLAEIPG